MPLPAFGRQPMKSGSAKSGFTLVEILIVIAIIIILISMMVGVGRRIDDQGKVRLCRSTIDLIGNALEQFRDFGYEYKDPCYAGLAFPLDCNGFDDITYFQNTLHDALYSSTPPTITISGWAQHDPSFSGSEALYFILSQVPDCRTTLEKIGKSLLINKGTDGGEINITIDAMILPFTRFIDPGGTTLHYDYYDETSSPLDPDTKKTFPVITSAGADKTFGTNDDISSSQQ
jgi:prepilin-type N-terminal cleavage/methylation domain-containing protein